MSTKPAYASLVVQVSRTYVEQRLACSVTGPARLLVEELALNQNSVPARDQLVFRHMLAEMHDALLRTTECERAEALGYAIGEFLEWLIDIAPPCSCGRCADNAG